MSKVIQIICAKSGIRGEPVFFEGGLLEFYEGLKAFLDGEAGDSQERLDRFDDMRSDLVLVLNEKDSSGEYCYSMLPLFTVGKIYDLFLEGASEPSSPFFPSGAN